MSTPSSASPPQRSRWSAAVPAWVRSAYAAAAVRPRSRSTRAQASSRSVPMVGRSSTVIRTVSECRRRVATCSSSAGRADGHVGRVTERGRDPQRALPGAADDDRDVADRPRVAGRLRQADPRAVVRLGAGAPTAPSSSRCPRSRSSSRCLAGGKSRPYAACSRSHQPAPTPDEGAATGQHVEGGGRLGGDARGAERHRRDQGAELEPGAQPGDRAQGDPRLRDRRPGPVDLRDLDQVVHHRQAGEARPRRPPGRRRSARPAAPRPTGTG